MTSDIRNPGEHYNRAEKAMKKIFESAKTLVNIDADGLESTIMQAVNSPTPGGLNLQKINDIVNAVVKKGRVLVMDLVQISPSFEGRRITLIHAERLICNFIGAAVRQGYYS